MLGDGFHQTWIYAVFNLTKCVQPKRGLCFISL